MRAVALVLFVAAAAGAQSRPANPPFQYPQAGVQAPVPIRKADPQYTPQARKAGIEGTVLLNVEVGTDGRAHRIRVMKGLGYGLDAKAIEAMRQWRFQPGTKNGLLVNTPAAIEIHFRLTNAQRATARV